MAIDIAICPHPIRILNKSCFTIIETYYIIVSYCLLSESRVRVCLITYASIPFEQFSSVIILNGNYCLISMVSYLALNYLTIITRKLQ